jgi:hypothetical protein
MQRNSADAECGSITDRLKGFAPVGDSAGRPSGGATRKYRLTAADGGLFIVESPARDVVRLCGTSFTQSFMGWVLPA